MSYNSTGSWIASAGLIVLILNHFNISVGQTDIEAVIAGVIALVGIVHAAINHKNIAVIAGMK